MPAVQTKPNATSQKPPADTAAEIGLLRLSELLREGSLTAEVLTSQYFQRIEAIDPKLDSFFWRNTDAVGAARDIDRRRAAGEKLGALAGMPVAIKQIFSVADCPSSPASELDVASLISPEGPFVAALKAAGVVLLGLNSYNRVRCRDNQHDKACTMESLGCRNEAGLWRLQSWLGGRSRRRPLRFCSRLRYRRLCPISSSNVRRRRFQAQPRSMAYRRRFSAFANVRYGWSFRQLRGRYSIYLRNPSAICELAQKRPKQI